MWRYLRIAVSRYEMEDVRSYDDAIFSYHGWRIIIGPIYIVIAGRPLFRD